MIRRFACIAGAVALAGAILVGCQGEAQAPDSAIVQIRNLTASTAAVQITEPYSGTMTHGAPPWHPGDCSLAFGTAPGHVAVGVRGPSIEGNPTYAVEVVANGPQVWITVTIGANGRHLTGVRASEIVRLTVYRHTE
jgi:hypothetical protein